MIVVERTRVSQVTPVTPSIPRAMVLRLIPRSPRRPGSFATVTRGLLRKLDTSIGVSGPHGFAVRKSGALVYGTACVHRIPLPTSVTIMSRPS
jgi:hypothetical protein